MKPLIWCFVLGTAVSACGSSRNDCSVKFSDPPKLAEIQSQIFDRSCAFTSCHGATDTKPKGGPMFLTAGKAHASLVTVSYGRPSTQRVVPGNPSSSFLMDKLTQDMPADNGTKMPQGATPLCAPEVETIRKWIAVGAKND